VGKRDFKSNYNPFIPNRNYKHFITAYLSAKLLKKNKLEFELSKLKSYERFKYAFLAEDLTPLRAKLLS